MLTSSWGAVRGVVLAVALMSITSCACRTKRPEGEGNIPVAEAGGVLRDVYFGFDSYEIDDAGREILKENSDWLLQYPDTRVQVEGHADERGTTEYNLALGEKRAKAAADYLRSLGVAADRISIVSYGEELPLDPRSTEEAWAKNRRAHFDVTE